MQQFDLQDVRYTGYNLPPQALKSKEKTEAWKKACMDALENIGIRQISENRVRFDDSFRILNGKFEYRQFTRSSAFLSEADRLRKQSKLEDDLVNYSFIEPLANHLVGEFIKSPNSFFIEAVDALSKNDHIEVKTDKLWSSVNQQVENMLNHKLIKQGVNPFKQEFESEEEKQQYLQEIERFKNENSPSEIEKYMNQSWRAVYIDWAEATLEEDYALYDIDELDRDDMYHYLATGKCFRHYMVGYDFYKPEHWHIFDTFYDDAVKRVEDGEYAGQVRDVPPNQLIASWGHLFSEKEKKQILRSDNFNKNTLSSYTSNEQELTPWDLIENDGGELRAVPFEGYYPYRNAKYIQDETGIDLGMEDEFPNNGLYDNDPFDDFYYGSRQDTDLVRYIFGYWVSYQRTGYLTIYDEEIQELRQEIVTDELLYDYIKENDIKQLKTVSLEEHEKNPEPNTIVWDFLPQVWKGLKIKKQNTDLDDDLYKGIEPLEYQLKGDSLKYHTKLPVVGINEDDSFVGRIEQEQIDYNFAMNMARDYMTQELGVFYVMDLSYMPTWMKNYGGEESITKMMDLIKEMKILPVDGENNRSNFNQFASVNMDLSQAMMGKLESAQYYKRLAFEKLGFSQERLGTPTQGTATANQEAMEASFNQTEIWFDKFANYQKRAAQIHLNIAQYVKKEGIDGSVSTTDSYRHRKFINMSDPELPLRHFRITPENNARRRSELETMKQVYMNDNTIEKDLEDVAEVLSADSVSTVLKLGKYGRQLREKREQQQKQHELKQQQLKDKNEQERRQKERMFEAEQNRLDREASILEQQIQALGFENKEQGQQTIDQTKLALEQLKQRHEDRRKEMEERHNKENSDKDERLKERELDIKEQELEVDKYEADMQYKIAKENKNQYDLKAQKQNNSENNKDNNKNSNKK